MIDRPALSSKVRARRNHVIARSEATKQPRSCDVGKACAPQKQPVMAGLDPAIYPQLIGSSCAQPPGSHAAAPDHRAKLAGSIPATTRGIVAAQFHAVAGRRPGPWATNKKPGPPAAAHDFIQRQVGRAGRWATRPWATRNDNYAPIAIALLLILLLPLIAHADPTTEIDIRSGSHPGYGRVVFDTRPHTTYRVVRDGDQLTIQFAGDVTLKANDAPPPHNVSAIHADGNEATLIIAPGSTFHDSRLGNRVVIDILDPGGAVPAHGSLQVAQHPPPAAEKPATPPMHLSNDTGPTQPPPVAEPPSDPPAPSRQAPLAPSPPPVVAATTIAAVAPADAAPPTPGPAPAPAPAPAASAPPQPLEPAPLQARPAPLPPETQGAAFTLPLPADAAAAVFHRHGETLVVFDQHEPIDLAPLQSMPAFASARAELLPTATVIHLSPPAGTTVALSKTTQGWTVAALSSPPQTRAISVRNNDNAVGLAAQAPGRVVTLQDPSTGGPLLVGTLFQPGQATVVRSITPQFELLPTRQGVVVVPFADTVALHTVADGFILTTAPAPLAVSRLDTDMLSDPAALTRRFEFPDLPPDRLFRLLDKNIALAANEPLLARGPDRRAAALDMISLGMDAEAEALLQLTAAEDPREAASADIAGLTGVAALLAGRPAEAGGIDDPRLSGTDEVDLWRALRLAMQDEHSPQAAAALANSAALLLSYPRGIRDRALALAAETMVQGGAVAAAAELLSRAKDVPGLELANAMLCQAQGDTSKALARYDALAVSRDQFVSARAAVRAVKLRLATGQFDKRQAAEALDRLLYAWRGGEREMALRGELASLRQSLGEYHQALTLLRETESLFPASAPTIHERLQQTFDAMLKDGAADRMPPLEFVALVDENADLIAQTSQGEAIEEELANKLVALDLPDRAEPVLDKLMRTAPPGPGRATIGLRLATLRLHEGDAVGALAALDASEVPGLPPALAQQRALLRAGAQARAGHVATAINLLAGLTSDAAAAERVDILEHAQDWRGAEQALAALAAKAVPASGDLTDHARRLVLRLVTDAAHAGDQPMLATLRAQDEARMGTGPLADMFRLLTTDPVQGLADLPVSAREVGLAKALPSALQAMQPSGRTP